MHYNFGIKWLKAFRTSSETVCALYRDDFIFEDPMLDQINVNTKPDLLRLFAPYANTDRTNGVGLHNFRIRSYIGNKNFGLLRWEWSPEDCAVFVGLDVAGKEFITQGHTFHTFDKDGLITRESSWWDAASVARDVGLADAHYLPTGEKHTGATKSGDVALSGAKAGTLDFAKDWANALGRDTDVLRSLYADEFSLDAGKIEDHMETTITTTEMMKEQLGGMASGKYGKYTFEATEYIGDETCGLIHWNVSIEGADKFRGLDTGGKTLLGIGSTFHEYDADGKIVLESTYWEDNRILIQMGYPIVRPHYWNEDFDPASLG